MRVALAQVNPTVGAIDDNVERIVQAVTQAAGQGAELVVLPEQCIIGYPTKDLLWRQSIIDRNVAMIDRIAAVRPDVGVIVGFAEPNPGAVGRPIFNSAALLVDSGVQATWRKQLLPLYDVFDESRYFEPAVEPQPVVDFRGRKLGVLVCEDLLSEALFGRPLYRVDPVRALAHLGADLVVTVSASPFFVGKHARRRARCAEAAKALSAPVLLCNQVGGNDELVFDGSSCAFDPRGQCIGQARSFQEDTLVLDLADTRNNRREDVPTEVASVHDALVLGVRDYVRKCGFKSVVLGLSGGIDSAVTAAIAVAALGKENVRGVAMPSRFSSENSVTDAKQLAENFGVRCDVVEIEPMHAAFEASLAPHFAGREPDVTEENIQARVRGALLMALSNKFGDLLLTTGNKSELAVGYCTLYGDMCGGLAVISDVPKTLVYALARHINERAGRALVPESTITKRPSAELRPDQHDQQSLPPYDVLDAILERYEERLESPEQIIAAGLDAEAVRRVIPLIQASEYKRQQAAPGLKVTSRAFGTGRRMPIAARLPR
jgi:NAD+ synthase/NAD+ synthase (glutamine-hydrolysing)